MRVSSLWLMSNEVGLLSATVYCPWRIDFPLSYYAQEGYGSRHGVPKGKVEISQQTCTTTH